MKRNNILAKKRLMKTTTYITALLVAVTMILSSAATVATVNENENVSIEGSTPTAPASTGGDADSIAPADPEISSAFLEKEYESGGARGVVVYDNGMSAISLAASHDCSAYDAFSADDFTFAADQDVSDVHWIGGYWNGATVPFDWSIEFFEDDGTGTSPGASFAAFAFAYADITMIDLGSQYFEMSVDLPSVVTFDGGQKYWICIWGTSEYPPQAGFGFHYSIIGASGVFGSVYFGVPFWTPQGRDHAFQLTLAAEHDVYADEIITPTTLSEFCPCTPVEATFKNIGIVDETDVPVSVEIRRYVFVDDFSAPWMNWYEVPWGNHWNYVPLETAYPGIVTPRSAPFMVELDSGLTGHGGSDFISFPIDLTGLCHPMMSFYMWHDEYGSDDYIDVYANDGGGWINIGGPFNRLCCPDCPVGWQEHVIDLSAFAGLTQVSFEGNCDSNPGAYNLQIDDFSLYDQEYYEEDEVDIDVGQTVTVEFPEWCPCNWQDPAWADTFFDIEVVACTDLDTDEVPANDCVSEVMTMYMPFEHDIAAISIDEPVGNVVPVDTFEMCGTIKNVGQYEECCFSIYMTVEEVVYGAYTTVFTEDFNSGTPYGPPPAGWTEETPTGNWRTYYNFYAGGSSPYELQFYWIPYAMGTYRCISPPIDTTGMPEVKVEFEHYLSHFSGAYTLSVETSTTGLPGSFTPIPELTWTNPTGWGATHEDEDVTQDVGSTLYLAFTFSGMPYNLNWWDIDDLVVSGRTITFLPPEYEDSYCIDDIDVCEEVQICFDDWTPATPYPDCGEITYRICLETKLCDPMDDNPANDMTCEFITVEFWHDVSVELTSPAKRQQTFYGLEVYPGTNVISFDPTDPNTLSIIAVGLPAGSFYAGTWFDDKWYVTDNAGLGLYTVDTGTGVFTSISNTGQAYNGIASDGTTMYGVTSTALYTINLAGGSTLVGNLGSAGLMIDIAIDMNTGIAYGHDIVDDSIYTINLGTGAATYVGPTGFDGNYAQGMEFDQDNDILYLALFDNIAFMGELVTIDVGTGAGTLIGTLGTVTTEVTCLAIPYVGGGPPPTPPVDIWIPCGEQDFCATFENLGTFDEPGCIIDWTLYEWDAGPQYLDGGSDTIDLDVGEVVDDYCFGSYDFVDDGVYILEVEIIAPVIDCYLDNNEDDVVIGVDCCPPETTFVLDPEQPDGENNWFISEITVTVDAVDCCDPPYIGSGVKEIKYKVNGVEGSISGDHGTIMLEDDGVHLVELWAIDNAGNEEAQHHTFEVAIDTGDPSIDLIYEAYEEDDGWHVDFTALASDDTSGIDKVEFYIGSSLEGTLTEAPFVWSIAWEDGYETTTFKATAYDNAGNSASDTVDGSIIEAVPYFHSQPTVPVWLVQPVQQQQTNPLVKL